METPAAIANGFCDLHFHDDTFIGMKVLPAQSRGDTVGSVVEIQLLQYSEQKQRLLRFSGCANLRVGIDFDVLAVNLPPTTVGVEAHCDPNKMWSLMQSQTRDWGVQYGQSTTPLDRKLEMMNELVCFRVQLCGGVIEILARQYYVEDIEQ